MIDIDKNETFGLVACAGTLPIEFINNLAINNIKDIAVIGFKGQTPIEVIDRATYYQEIGLGQMNKGIKFFKSHNVKNIVMLGWIDPKLTISNLKMDFRMLALAARTKDRRADNVLSVLISEIEKDGFQILENRPFLKSILVEDGVLTNKKPTKAQLDDINLGKEIALTSGGLDIGQTAIINKHAVVAVEAMEGTDKCIIRAGDIVKGNVIVKMAKPNQDFRFDIPCIGAKTIEKMVASKSSLLAVEAGKTYILEKEKTIQLANKHKIVIVGINR